MPHACRATIITLGVLLGVALVMLAMDEAFEGKDDDEVKLQPVCTQLQGGGQLGANGAFPLQLPRQCTKQVTSYYYPDNDQTGGWMVDVAAVTTAMQAALRSLAQQPSKGPPRHVVIMDVDDTALSNLEALGVFPDDDDIPKHKGMLQPQDRRRRGLLGIGIQGPHAGAASTDGSPQHSHTGRSLSGQQQQGALGATTLPAIAPVLRLYQSVQQLGFSVVFLTNRVESRRAATVANLAAAGYGPQCNASAPQPQQACWEQLLRRRDNDTRCGP